MDFRIDALLPATATQLWEIFFDVKRVATLIPGCENVEEVEKLKVFSAVMRQKIGPFKLDVPTRIDIESYEIERQVSLKAAGRDKATGTTIDVGMVVNLEEQRDGDEVLCKLDVSASMQVAGRLASLGYPIVRKRSEQLFAEFEARLRAELANLDGGRSAEPQAELATTAAGTPVRDRAPRPPASSQAARTAGVAPASAPRSGGATELVFLWPRLGINVAAALGVAHGAVALGQSPWWWLAAPLLGVAASLGKRAD
ncbi:CoxG family protein [Bordetella sp. LUAb4]|uniref:CoxG family protein n=1 Tax=Bordetella sp. LUAb4 TaxID=2843195 RepID=UPI001E2DEA24|nr:SRPBCC domain-containing protein [Bordetella sp. LUAb4]